LVDRHDRHFGLAQRRVRILAPPGGPLPGILPGRAGTQQRRLPAQPLAPPVDLPAAPGHDTQAGATCHRIRRARIRAAIVDRDLARDAQHLAVVIQCSDGGGRHHGIEIDAPLHQPGLQHLHVGADAPGRLQRPGHGVDAAPGHQAEHRHHRQRHQHFDQCESGGTLPVGARHWKLPTMVAMR
jgi:hypothetical protein